MKFIVILTLLSTFQLKTTGQKVIRMTKMGGVSVVPCKVNGLKLSFIFDTGASTVSLSSTEANFMFKNGFLDSTDILGTGKYTDATGAVNEAVIINLKEIEFGGYKIRNIQATIINNANAPLLLGQSVFREIGRVQIDFEKNELLIVERDNITLGTSNKIEKVKQTSNIPEESVLLYRRLIMNALNDTTLNDNAIKNKFDSAAVLYTQYKELKELDTLAFALFYYRGLEKLRNIDKEGAIKDYSIAIETNQNNKFVTEAYLARAEIYYELEHWNKAIIDYDNYLKTSFLPFYSNDSIIDAFSNRAYCKLQSEDYISAIKDYNELIEKSNKKGMSRGMQYYNRSKCKFFLEDYYGALSDVNKSVLLLDKQYSRICSNTFFLRSNIRFYMKQYFEALADIETAINYYEGCSLLYNRGIIKNKLKNKKGACMDLSKAGELGCSEAYEAIKEICN